MPTFSFQGRDIDGKLIAGKRLAQSADSLSGQLLKESITPVQIKLVADSTNPFRQLRELFQNNAVETDELSMFSRQMHTLCKTGVPITSAIKQLAENSRSQRLADALRGMVEHLESGQDLAGSMQRYPNVFTPIMVSMIRVGQNSGRLDEAFLRLNQYLELEANTVKRLKGAARYPMFVLIAIVVAIILVNIFVIPTFANVFQRANVPLPAMTIFLIGMSAFMRKYWIPLLVLICAIASMLYYYVNKTPQGQLAWGHYKMHMPILGRIFKRIVLLRFAQTFAVIVNAGISLVEGLSLVAEAIGNPYARREVLLMQEAIQRGKTLTQAATGSDLFTSLELQMLSVSEETGELGAMLEQIAIFYQREVDYDLKRLNDIIEPVLTVALAGMVLMLAFAVYLPIWNMVKLVHS